MVVLLSNNISANFDCFPIVFKRKGVSKQENEKALVPPLLQENVFVEGSRHKYLEDLHSEAQEGLKLLQQEENNGVNYRDDESSISTVMAQPDEDGVMTDSTIPDTCSTVSTQSTISTRSSRSGLTRQASTFRPLNSGKKSERTKTRRRHRKTVVGIPQHVQRELGLDRVRWTLSRVVDEEQLPNGDTVDTIDGLHQAAEQNTGVVQHLSEARVKQFNSLHAGHRDDLALLHFGPQLSDSQRPRSLAVPWMTTANSHQQPPSPVMSMSPQATYMSKIIPNAVLLPSIDVVEISRGQSRNSVRTISKSSLLLASPASSRASSRASSSRASTLTSASRYNPPHLSDSSGWSRSESSETLVSDSSTISSSSTPRQGRSQEGDAEGSSSKENKVSVYSSVSKVSKTTSNGKPRTKDDEVKKEGPFARSLSVMKPKRAPPPPSRSYSLHKMKRRSRDLAEVRVIAGGSPTQSTSASGGESVENKSGAVKEVESSPMSPRIPDSPGYSADTSSLDDSTGSVSVSPLKSQLQTPEKEESVKVDEPATKDTSPEKQEPPQENGLKTTVSPSSGYSSQGGTPTLPSKKPHSSSPRHKRGILAKLQSLFPGSSPPPAPVISNPSPLTQPDAPESTKPAEPPLPQPNPPVDTVTSSPSVKALRELFNIPPPPKVHAPPPPPPEVWAHSKRTFELLLGPPAPNDVYAVIRRNPKDRRQQRQPPSVSKESSAKSSSGERRQESQTLPAELNNGALYVLGTGKVQESERLNPDGPKEQNERLTRLEQSLDVKGNGKVAENDEKVKGSELINGMSVKVVEKPEERLSAEQQEAAKAATPTQNYVTELKSKMGTLSAILARVSPSPSPPPAHYPPLPPTKQSPPVDTTDAAPAPEPSMSPTGESSWPPPPPPMVQVAETQLDLPLPPPPSLSEEGLVVPHRAPTVEVPCEQFTPPTTVIPQSNSEQSDSTRITTSVTKVKNTEHLTGATPEPLQPRAEVASAPQLLQPAPILAAYIRQGIPQSIPPPPPYAAPAPPVQKVSPPPAQQVSLPPPHEVSPPPAQVVSPPPPQVISPPPPQVVSPPPPQVVSPPPPQEVSPPPPKEVSLPPPQVISPPPPQVVSLPPPQVISPPPPQVISPPPPQVVSLPPPQVISPPPPQVISPPLPQEVSPPPPQVISPPPPQVISPPPPQVVSPPPPQVISPPPPQVVSPPPPQEVSLPPPQVISPPPPQVISPPPPQVVSPPPPQEVSPPPPQVISPPPPQVISPPLPQEVSPPPPQEVSPPPPQEVSPQPPQEVSPPPPQVISPPPPQVISPPLPQEVSPPPPQEVSPPPPQEVSPPPPQEVSPQPPQEVSPPPPQVISPPPPQEVSPPPAEEVAPPPSQDAATPSENIPSPPQSIPPPPQSIPPPPQEPPPPPQEDPIPLAQYINLPPETIPPPPDNIPPPPENVLSLPLSIPPPPPPQVVPLPPTDGNHLAAQALHPPPPTEIPPPPPLETLLVPQEAPEPVPALPVIISQPLPVQATADIKSQPSPVITENQNPEQKSQNKTSPPAIEDAPSILLTPSPLQTVQLRSVNGSPDPTKAQDQTQNQAQPEVTIRAQQPKKVPTPATSGEAPQKPIRRSLIVTSPTSITPPTIVTSQPAIVKSQATMVIPTSTSTVTSPTRKSPPVMATSPSVKLQEAIRLRTAARSKDGPPSRLSLQSPTSPPGEDIHKSPSCTASFIFSKSTKKVVIDTTSSPEAQAKSQKNWAAELSSVSQLVKEADSQKKGAKVPPPVAKKPKSKTKDAESSAETEHVQTAGQEAQPESTEGTPEKPNGTACSVEGQASST